jgi:hypothetical protein
LEIKQALRIESVERMEMRVRELRHAVVLGDAEWLAALIAVVNEANYMQELELLL